MSLLSFSSALEIDSCRVFVNQQNYHCVPLLVCVPIYHLKAICVAAFNGYKATLRIATQVFMRTQIFISYGKDTRNGILMCISKNSPNFYKITFPFCILIVSSVIRL